MWFKDKRTNEKGVCSYVEWHIMCYGARTLLPCGELPDTRGILHSVAVGTILIFFELGSRNSRSFEAIHAGTRIPKIRERAA